MDDAMLVREVHGVRQRLHERGRLQHRLRLSPHLPIQAAAIDKLKRKERLAVVAADFVDLHDVRMLQASDRLGLGAEPLHILFVGVGAGEDHLERDEALELDVPRLVDDAHATPAQHGEKLIALDRRELAAGRRRRHRLVGDAARRAANVERASGLWRRGRAVGRVGIA